MGDSLSDRGTMFKRMLLGFIPMSFLTGLSKHSPTGRFTNGLTWVDHLSADLGNEFTIQSLKKNYGLDACDIADGVITNDPRVKTALHNNYNLHDNTKVNYNGMDMVRTFTEGGVTSHSYRGVPSTSIPRFFARLILNSLSRLRERVFADDIANNVSAEKKAHTLTVEWTGANDMMTVNAKPSKAEADRAVKDRIKNVEQMIQHGYKHFVLFNMPDLSLTPRYQAMSSVEQKNARECCNYFNQQLEEAVRKINQKYPDATVDVFDVATKFTEVYNNPEKYGFEKEKLTHPYIKSKDFKINSNGTSPAKGYMFWDDVHPSGRMQDILAEELSDKYKDKFHYAAPDTEIARTRSAPNLHSTNKSVPVEEEERTSSMTMACA